MTTTRDWVALHWLVLCCASSFAFATVPDLPFETALLSLSSDKNALQVDTQSTSSNASPVFEPVATHTLLREDVQILWPMMPNDTLAKLAHTLYPNSPILAQRFMQKSIRLSKALGVVIDSDTPFQHAQIIAIPNEKEVRALTHRIKKREELTPENNQLLLSYQLKQPPHAVSRTTKTSDHAVKAVMLSSPVNLHLPEVGVPKITLPTLRPPDFTNLGDRLNVVWNNVQTQMQAMWQFVMKTVLAWNSDLVDLKTRLRTQSASEVLQDSTVKPALLLGVPMLLVALIWQLQRHYLRRKVTLLNTIPSTLVEPELGEISTMPNLEDQHMEDNTPDNTPNPEPKDSTRT